MQASCAFETADDQRDAATLPSSRIKLDLVYNPASGRFRRSRLDALVRALAANGFEPRPIATHADGFALPDDAQIVCVYGGDGAVRLAVQALGDRAGAVPLCVVPCGTINLIARELGYVADPGVFAGRLAQAWHRGESRWLSSPLLTCGTIPVMACLSLGPDSAAVAGVDPALKARIGRYAYAVAAGRLLWGWRRQSFRVQAELADGTALDMRAEAAFVARGRFYAGPFRLSARAALHSEGFELILLPHAGRLRSLAFALAVALRLPIDRLGLARIYTVRRVSFPDGGVPVQVDGDAIPAGALSASMNGLVARFCV